MGAFDIADKVAPIAEVAGGLFSSASAINQGALNRKMQRDMSNSAHQREVLDLKKAGLNPILSATGGSGASTPSGSMANPDNPVKGLTQNLASAKQATSNVALNNQQILNSTKELLKTVAETQLTTAKAKREEILSDLDKKYSPAERDLLYNMLGNQGASSDINLKTLQYQTPYIRNSTKLNWNVLDKTWKSTVNSAKSDAMIKASEAERAQAMKSLWHDPFGQKIAPIFELYHYLK